MLHDEITDLEEVKKFLGYTDLRSVVRWCQKNSIPVFMAGKKRYVASEKLTDIIDNQLVIFVKPNAAAKKQKINSRTKYEPHNDIVSKYLQKYESNNKTKAA